MRNLVYFSPNGFFSAPISHVLEHQTASSLQTGERLVSQNTTGRDHCSGRSESPLGSDVEPKSSVSQNMTGFERRPLQRKLCGNGAIKVGPNPILLVKKRRFGYTQERKQGHMRT